MNFEIETLPVVTCEFDIEPPNPVSAGLHATFGFREVGQQRRGWRHKGGPVAGRSGPPAE